MRVVVTVRSRFILIKVDQWKERGSRVRLDMEKENSYVEELLNIHFEKEKMHYLSNMLTKYSSKKIPLTPG